MKVLVTGGTSKIGEAILRKIAPGNDLITTVSSASSNFDLTASDLRAQSLEVIECDFSNFDYENEKIISKARGGVDIVVINACTKMPNYKLLHEHDIEALFNFVQENTKPNLQILQSVLPGMMEKHFGRIVFISTMAVEMGMSSYSPYIIAKGSLEGLMKNIAVDYGAYNIYANTLRPGIIRTERTAQFLKNPKYELRAKRIIPAGQVGEPHQIAEVVATLVSPTSYINGQTINASGGLPLVSSLVKI